MVEQLKQRLISYLRDNSTVYKFEEFRRNREFITKRIFIP
jgi:hypothetical protein